MKKYFIPFILFTLFSTTILAQSRIEPNTSLVESELHLYKAAEGFTGYFLYKIPHSRLVFLKKENVFQAGFKVSIEIREQKSGAIIRDFNEQYTSVQEFQLTNAPYLYVQGIMKFKINSGEHSLTPVYSDLNSNREFQSKPILFYTDSIDQVFGSPVIITSEKQRCHDEEFYKLANYSASFPFSSESYSLLIPVFDEDINNVNVEITKKGSKQIDFSSNIDEYFESSVNFAICEGNIVFEEIKNLESEVIRFFVLRDLSIQLFEGLYSLSVSTFSEQNVHRKYDIAVRWINKPRSLIEPEKSLDYLLLIENPEIVSELKDVRKDDLQKSLFEFWKKYDPTPETKYNELMTEFYSRIDYSEQNFRALSNNNGVRSDRGKIYVQFGNPESMERFTDEYGRMLEQWKYLNPVRIFTFIDKKGTGNFTLLNSQ